MELSAKMNVEINLFIVYLYQMEEFIELNLPMADLRLKTEGQSKQIFDSVRKKFVALTPEEWVRQHFIHFMINTKKYPASLMGVEMLVKVNNLSQRSDIVVFQSNGKPWLIVECKAPHITINQDTFYQAARYNSSLKVPFIVITNGLEHYCLHFNGKDFDYLDDLPDFS